MTIEHLVNVGVAGAMAKAPAVTAGLLVAAAFFGLPGLADAHLIKTWVASGLRDATDLECGRSPAPPHDACFDIPFSAQLEYIDPHPGQDNQIGLGQVTSLQYIDRIGSFSFQYSAFGPVSAPPLGASLLAALVQEHGNTIEFSASVLRMDGGSGTQWEFDPVGVGSFSMSDGHGEGGIAPAGAVQWQLLRTTEVPEPGGLLLAALALAGLGMQRKHSVRQAKLHSQMRSAVAQGSALTSP